MKDIGEQKEEEPRLPRKKTGERKEEAPDYHIKCRI